MILDFCVACGEREPSRLENHHLVPRSAGGSDEPANLITLCFDCHGKAHGYRRRDIRKLVKSGIVLAKANGKRPGNPGMLNRDPEAIRKVTEARDAKYFARLKATADTWLPTVQRMRPKMSWEEVAAAISAETGQKWTETKLRRSVGRFIDAGMADPILLKSVRPSRRYSRAPRMPNKTEPSLQAVADLINTTPSITIPDLARKLEAMGVQKPGGSARWSKPATEKYVEWARTLGMLL